MHTTFSAIFTHLYDSTESYCCNFEMDIDIGISYFKVFFYVMGKVGQVSYPIQNRSYFKGKELLTTTLFPRTVKPFQNGTFYKILAPVEVNSFL